MITRIGDAEVFNVPCGKCGRGQLTHRHCRVCDESLEHDRVGTHIMLLYVSGGTQSYDFCSEDHLCEHVLDNQDILDDQDNQEPKKCHECGIFVELEDPTTCSLVVRGDIFVFCSAFCLRDYAVKACPKTV